MEPSLVREWLRAQAAGGYLDYEPVSGTFTLPEAGLRMPVPDVASGAGRPCSGNRRPLLCQQTR